MKYVVTRSSNGWSGNPKCPNSQKEMISKDGELVEAYTVDINSVEELDQFIAKVGHPIVVFKESDWGFELPEIEIYDDYRE